MSKLKIGVVQFPGSNCDHDAMYAWGEIAHQDVRLIWHKESSIGDTDIVFLPGGFSYGDYLRTGAIARFSPVMSDVVRFANNGGIVIGICNGFQILCEAGLLPGVLLPNQSLKFICKYLNLKVVNNKTNFSNQYAQNEIISIPIAHGDGNYFADDDTIKLLHDNDQIVYKYCSPEGEFTSDGNPNGSMESIAGIVNKNGNVFGMMPHPERAIEKSLGSIDGLRFLSSVTQLVSEKI